MIRATVAQPDTSDIAALADRICGDGPRDRESAFWAVSAARVFLQRKNQGTPTQGQVREFSTGATRDTDAGKIDYEGFLSPHALKAFGEYMDRHRHLPDGSVRASDNWQAGLPMDVYMKSMWRHFFDVWSEHRGVSTPAGLKENLCALKFNVDGMLHELVKAEADHTPGAGYAMPLADRED